MEVGLFVVIVVTALIGILAWLRAGHVGREQVAQNQRIADVQERLEQIGNVDREERRTQSREMLRVKLQNISKWVRDFPDSPKDGGWNHHPKTDEELTEFERLTMDSALDAPSGLNPLEHVTELVSAARRLSSAVQEARDREWGRVPGSRGYSSLEVQQWRMDREVVERTAATLVGLIPGGSPTQETDRT